MSHLPRYPVYIPSKGRYDTCHTAQMFRKDGVPFTLVVEEPEVEEYVTRWGRDKVLVLPHVDQGLHTTRNWILEHAKGQGHERHWQFDDNIRQMWRVWRGERLRCASGPALASAEDFVDRYTNVAIAGFEYYMFGVTVPTPFTLNCRVYSATLALNSMPFTWRDRFNDDTDICLQALSAGWCTVLIRAFMVQKMRTMTQGGGNTSIYEADGRRQMSRALERRWPGVVTTRRKFGRAQHSVRDNWKRFDTPLQRKPDLEVPTGVNEYGLRMKQVKEIQHPDVEKMLEQSGGIPLEEGT